MDRMQRPGAADAAGQAFDRLQEKKRREEERLHGVVAHFVAGADNPISAGGAAAAQAKPPA